MPWTRGPYTGDMDIPWIRGPYLGGMAMPLRKGRSQKTVVSNIKTLVHEYDQDGMIGTSHPSSRKKAIRQAVAISMRKAGGRRRKSSEGA
jgi:hypothetical protein